MEHQWDIKNSWHGHRWQCACLWRTATCECHEFFSSSQSGTHFTRISYPNLFVWETLIVLSGGCTHSAWIIYTNIYTSLITSLCTLVPSTRLCTLQAAIFSCCSGLLGRGLESAGENCSLQTPDRQTDRQTESSMEAAHCLKISFPSSSQILNQWNTYLQ